MKTLAHPTAQWRRDDSGVTAIEYGLLSALIAVAIIGAVSAAGTALNAVYAAWSAAVVAAV